MIRTAPDDQEIRYSDQHPQEWKLVGNNETRRGDLTVPKGNDPIKNQLGVILPRLQKVNSPTYLSIPRLLQRKNLKDSCAIASPQQSA